MTKLKTQSLHKRESDLANANRQLEILSNGIFKNGELTTFSNKIKETNQIKNSTQADEFSKEILRLSSL